MRRRGWTPTWDAADVDMDMVMGRGGGVRKVQGRVADRLADRPSGFVWVMFNFFFTFTFDCSFVRASSMAGRWSPMGTLIWLGLGMDMDHRQPARLDTRVLGVEAGDESS